MSCIFEGELCIQQPDGTQVLIDTMDISAVEEVKGGTSAVLLRNGTKYLSTDSMDTTKQKIEDSEDEGYW